MGDYIIKKGDNLTKIAKEYGTTVKALQEANGIKNANRIIAGKTLKVPDGKGISVERMEPKPEDSSIRKAREIAHEKELERLEALKNNKIDMIPDIVVTGRAPKKDVAVSKLNTEEILKTEMDKRHIKNVNMAYWVPKIDKVASNYDIDPELLVPFIARESGFKPNAVGRNSKGIITGRGAMGQTTIAVKDFFPGVQGRYDLYNQLDSKLLDDILFRKDSEGNVIKDANGKPVLKYSSYTALLNQCAKDDELSIKIGALDIKLNYVQVISRATGKNIKTVIDDIKSGKLKVSNEARKKYIAEAIKNYNGSHLANAYRDDVVDSLRIQKYDYSHPIVRCN